MRGKCFLVDLSWLLYRSHFAYKGMTIRVDGMEESVGALYGFLQSLERLLEHKAAPIVFALDSKPTGNLALLDSYKEGRRGKEVSVYRWYDIVMALLSPFYPQVAMVRREGTEADDLIYALARSLGKNQDVDTFIYAMDSDLYQCVAENVFLFSKWKNGDPAELIDVKKVGEKFGVFPRSVAMYKAIIGDRADNVPSVLPRFPRVLARAIALRFSSPEEFFAGDGINFYDWKELRSTYFDWLLELWNLREDLERNYGITKLSEEFYETDFVQSVGVSGEELSAIVERYGLHSFYILLKNYGNKRVTKGKMVC